MKQKNILEQMTLKDKIKLCSGLNFWHTKEMKQYGIPSVMMADGPHGLRKQAASSDMLGINRSVPATCFPAAVLTACSWDTKLLGEVGGAIAAEAAANGVGVVLGPGVNIKRNPLCGRNFEYFSEDPYLAGKLAAAFIRSAEETGISTSLKHFACNNQEYKRFVSDSMMDERTLREIYLSGFEIAVKEGHPSTVMCAYNKVNGEHCSDSKKLLTDILRREWGFEGAMVTDWGAMGDRIKAFEAGCDLCMPGGSAYMEKEAFQAVRNGSLKEEDIERSVRRILNLADRASKAEYGVPADMEAHFQLAKKAAEESAVLLKNADGLLPVRERKGIVLIGHMAEKMRYQGAGSSHINPWKLQNPVDICPDIPYVPGCDKYGGTDETLLRDAVNAAREAKTAIVFAGLTDQYESEGFDREDMKMPEGYDRLIGEVAKANPNTAVVLFCGSAVEIPWEDSVKSILYMGLPGEAGAEAALNLLFGDAVPCGKLAESWPYRYEDCVSSSYYGTRDAHYREGVYVGYRYYSSANIPVRYPFGFGLSYTDFAYSDIGIHDSTVSCMVENTGERRAKEIVQLYVSPPGGNYYRPAKELKRFCKIELAPREKKRVSFTLDERCFAVWDEGFVIPAGKYGILIGPDSENLPLKAVMDVGGTCRPALSAPEWYRKPTGVPSEEDFVKLTGRECVEECFHKGRYTMENTIMEMKEDSLLMKILFRVMGFVIARGTGGKKDDRNPEYRMMMSSSVDAPLRVIKINGGVNCRLLEGLLKIINACRR